MSFVGREKETKKIIKTKTKGQIEDSIAKEVIKFYVKNMGVGPRETQVYVLRDMIIVRLKGRLLPFEKILLGHDKGVSLIKDSRKIIHELTVGGLSKIINKITNHKIISSHSDISTKTGEIIQVYIIDINYENELHKQLLGS